MVQGPSSNKPEQVGSFFHDLRALNARHPGESSSLLDKISRTRERRFKPSPEPSVEELWEVHASAEHMATEEFRGNDFYRSLQIPIRYLEETGHKELAKNLSSALGDKDPSRCEKNVSDLPEGQSLVMRASTRKHALILEITCTGVDSAKEKLYTVTVHNTGTGVVQYHPKGKGNRYQTAYILENVSEERLCGSRSDFFSKLNLMAPVRNVNYLYEEVLPSLGGTLVEKPEDRRLWSHGQLGGSCTASSVLAFLRSRMTDQEFKQFRDVIRKETFLRMYRRIIEGEAPDHAANIALEIARKLQSRIYKASGSLDPQYLELANARQRIEQAETMRRQGFVHLPQHPEYAMGQLAPKSPSTSKGQEIHTPREPSPSGPSTSLIEIFHGIQEGGVYTSDRHQKLIKEFTEVRQKILTQGRLSAKEKKQLAQLSSELAKFVLSRPMLTKNQIYLCAGMLSLIATAANSNGVSLSPDFISAAHEMFDTYVRMSKKAETVQQNSEISALIDEGIGLIDQARRLMRHEPMGQSSLPRPPERREAERPVERETPESPKEETPSQTSSSTGSVDWGNAEQLRNTHKYQPANFSFENKPCSIWKNSHAGISIQIPGRPLVSLSKDNKHLYVDNKRYDIGDAGVQAHRKAFFDALRLALAHKRKQHHRPL